MKTKLLLGMLAIIFVVSLIMTAVKGLNVGTYYSEGYSIRFSIKDTINVEDVEQMAKDIWGKDYLVQKLELFNDSVEIKVKDYTDEQLNQLKDRVNEKYSEELEITNLKIEQVSNIKIRNVIEPYIIPVILSLVIVLIFYAIRFRGARKMLELLLWIIAVEGIAYSVYAIGRLPFNTLTMPITMSLYILTILGFTTINELKNKEDAED